eukprot:s3917_g3.t1
MVSQRAPPKPRASQAHAKEPPRAPSEAPETSEPQTVPLSVLDMALQQVTEVPAPPGLKLELPTEPGSAQPTAWTQFEWKPDDWKAFWQGFHDAAAAPTPPKSSPSSPASQSSGSAIPAKVAFLPETLQSPPG